MKIHANNRNIHAENEMADGNRRNLFEQESLCQERLFIPLKSFSHTSYAS